MISRNLLFSNNIVLLIKQCGFRLLYYVLMSFQNLLTSLLCVEPMNAVLELIYSPISAHVMYPFELTYLDVAIIK